MTTDIAKTLEAIIDTAIDGIITIDKNGTIETMNPAAASIFGYDSEEVIGHNVKVLMPDPDRTRHDGYLHNYLSTKVPKIIGVGREVKGMKKDGSTFPFRLAVSEVILADRIIFAGVVHDLSDIYIANEKLQKINDELEDKVEERTKELEDAINKLLKANKELEESQTQISIALSREKELGELKSRFVSMASHEFRTPLSTILSSASLIGKYDDEKGQPNREKHINKIKSAVTNLTGILNDFLSLSKIEEGREDYNIEEVKVSDVCLVVKSELSGILKNGQVIQDEYSGIPQPLFTDQRILKNILFNLASNAVKYSPDNSEIIIHVAFDKEEVMITVEDQGRGIPQEDQKHLFSRFFRASNVENIQGTGLGLHIVTMYLKRLGGSIDFKSEEGKGTTFFLNIPYETSMV